MTLIKTKRLTLRPFCLDDAPRIVALANDFEIARQTASMPHPFMLEDVENWLVSMPERSKVSYGITASGALMGEVAYNPVEADVVELSYWLGRPYWGRGFATEAAIGLLDLIFNDLAIAKVIAGHATDNQASQNIIEKLGFQYIGDTIYPSLARDADVPCLLYETPRAQYFKRYTS